MEPCCICFEETEPTEKQCETCHNSVCKECFPKIEKCPQCRDNTYNAFGIDYEVNDVHQTCRSCIVRIVNEKTGDEKKFVFKKHKRGMRIYKKQIICYDPFMCICCCVEITTLAKLDYMIA